MAFTAQQIADFYDQQVGGGKMNEAAFVDLARANGISDTLLTQARDVAVDRQIPTMTQPQVIAALTERAGRGGPLQVTATQNQSEGGGTMYSAGGSMLTPIITNAGGESADVVSGFERVLTPQFDPRYAGGQYGTYVGTYDPAGNLREVTFRQGERHGGFLNENMDTIANMAIMALSGIPGMLAPTLGTIGAGAAVGAGSGILGTLANGGSVGQAALRGGISGGISAAAGNILKGMFGANPNGSGAWLGENMPSGVDAWDEAFMRSGGVLENTAFGQGAWLGENVPSGVNTWDEAFVRQGGYLPNTGQGAWLGENVPSGVDEWDDAFRRAGGVFDDGWVSNMLDTQLDQNFERPSYDDFTRDTMNEWNNQFRAEPLGDGEDINGRSLYDDTTFDMIDEDPTGTGTNTGTTTNIDPPGQGTKTIIDPGGGGTGTITLIEDVIGSLVGAFVGPVITDRITERERPPTTTTPTPTATYVNPQTAEQAVRPTGPAVVGGAAGSIPGVAETLLTSRTGEDPLLLSGRRSVLLGR